MKVGEVKNPKEDVIVIKDIISEKKTSLKTGVALLLDETGSMGGMEEQVVSGINEYISTLRKEDPEVSFSLVRFSLWSGDVYRPWVTNARLGDVIEFPAEEYNPRGNTPLYDAIGKTVTDAEGKEVDRHLIVIYTDGLENSSQEYTREQIRNLIQKKEGLGNWTFVYLGAHENAWAASTAMGIQYGNTVSVDPSMPAATMDSVAVASAGYTSSPRNSTPTFFSDAGQTEEDYNQKKPKKPRAAGQLKS